VTIIIFVITQRRYTATNAASVSRRSVAYDVGLSLMDGWMDGWMDGMDGCTI